jgi:hypothetical protein
LSLLAVTTRSPSGENAQLKTATVPLEDGCALHNQVLPDEPARDGRTASAIASDSFCDERVR